MTKTRIAKAKRRALKEKNRKAKKKKKFCVIEQTNNGIKKQL